MTYEHLTWRNPDELPDYLDDDLEHSVIHHTFSIRYAAELTAGMMSSPDDPLLFDPEDPRRDREPTFESLKRLSPAAAGYYSDAEYILNSQADFHSPVQLIGHLLRELDSTIRVAWWELLRFADPNVKLPEGDANTHSGQITVLSNRFGLSFKETETWLTALNLNKHAHYRGVGAVKEFTPLFDQEARNLLALYTRAVTAAEALYGAALLRVARILSLGPSQAPKNALTQQIPNNPSLRQWFLAQIDDPRWVPVLYRFQYLDDAVDMYREKGSAVMPVSHGARTVARFANQCEDSYMVNQLVTQWLSVNNPRVHCDVLRILQLAPTPLYLEHVPKICELLADSKWHAETTRVLGGPGVLRFPSEALRLALRARQEKKRDAAQTIAISIADALNRSRLEDEQWRTSAQLAVIGAAPKNRGDSRWLVKILKQRRRR